MGEDVVKYYEGLSAFADTFNHKGRGACYE